MFKNKWLRIVLISFIVIFCVSLDQISKVIAISKLEEFHSVVLIKDFFSLTLCYNTGGAWSIFNDSTWALALVSVLALGFIIFTLFKYKGKLYTIAASIFMGGLIGNLIDRIFKSRVTDFLDFVIFGYDFPIFNVADIFIVCSAVMIIIALILGDKHEKDNKSE